MNILFFTYDYPDEHRSTFTFVKQLVDEIARQGHNCCVIAPYNVSRNRTKSHCKKDIVLENGAVITILRPKYLSFSNWKLGSIHLTVFSRKTAIHRAIRHLPFTPDICYGHFWNIAYEAYDFSFRNSIPLFVATGEDHITFGHDIPLKIKKEFSDYVSGVICVSSKNKKESIEKGLSIEEKCFVAPNAYNPVLFYPQEKKALRIKHGFDEDSFIVCFLGTFMNRKGVNRVSDAIISLNDSSIKSFFIGSEGEGENIRPSCDGILFEGRLPHTQIPEYLNMADVFVLPTLSEGCSNAIVEAIGCGLPIITSAKDFNYDILDESNSILVNPSDVCEIASAIRLLKNDTDLRYSLSKGAIARSKSLTIEDRASKIISFIKLKCHENNTAGK